ncbi:cell wall protein [Microbacterium terricola]|uniref:Cell wall protein n=1 Tax=Microbacterium terricola TaxID=344163 RepID=A0ABM8DW01_9MICO|nr:cell wall protein [Microbacterium terricola]UYK39510.1 cell wall protein [Microbacterium terricola]BDV29757.1 hypothetical protein Microterr_04170 [Microbacterium terricola]
MNRQLARAVVIGTVVGLAAVSAPAAANASLRYPPSGSCSVDTTTTTAGGSVEFSCVGDTFGPDDTVTVTLTGENGEDASFAFVHFAVSTGSTTRTATADGALEPVTVTLPAEASGVYNIEAISSSSAGGTASVTVGTSDDPLAGTGGDSAALLGVWIGGGALVLAGVAIIALTAARRARRDRS